MYTKTFLLASVSPAKIATVNYALSLRRKALTVTQNIRKRDGMRRDFQYYLSLWRRRFPRRRALLWRDSWLQNGYCRDCRYCCGPQDNSEPFPMALLPRQMRPGLGEDFYLLAEDVAYIADRGCKANDGHGCRLVREKRPVACCLFPLVLANGGLYLYKTCPAVIFTPLADLFDAGRSAATWLANFSPAELSHISLNLQAQTLRERYIYLDIAVAYLLQKPWESQRS
jgi:Fe-S-cluster containining protein